MKIPTLQRTLIEKTCRENGWEIISDSCDEETVLCSSSFLSEKASVAIFDNASYKIQFTDIIDKEEFCRTMNLTFENDSTIIVSKDDFAKVLKRASELFYSLPQNPLAQYRKQYKSEITKLLSDTKTLKTETERMVKQRVGQEKYREALMKYWQGKCSVTDCCINEALRASHAKPWKDCSSDKERLDVYNGFLLIANLDALFDKGLISFTDDGVIMISSEIEESMYSSLGLNKSMRLRWIDEKHLTYLKYHRENVFRN